MIFELVHDFAAALAVMPTEHPRRRILALLDEALRRDVHFIDRHPTTLFQCLWNTCWWYDCPDAARHFDWPEDSCSAAAPWHRQGLRLHQVLETWRADKEDSGAIWLRALDPPSQPLGTAQQALFQINQGEVHGVAISCDGRSLLTHSCAIPPVGPLDLWNADTGAHRMRLKGLFAGGAFSPDGRVLACLNGNLVQLRDPDTGEVLHSVQGSRSLVSVAFDLEGRTFACGDLQGEILLWDRETRQQIARLDASPLPAKGLAFSPDGHTLASWTHRDGAVRGWDVSTKSPSFLLSDSSLKGGVFCAAWSPDGTTLVVGGLGEAIAWNVTTCAVRFRLGGHVCVRGLAWSPDGRLIVTGSSADSTIRVWDAATGALRCHLLGHPRGVYCVAFSPDGETLATGSSDQTVRLWKTPLDEPVPEFSGQSCDVRKVMFSPDGRTLASLVYVEDGTRRFALLVDDVEPRRRRFVIVFRPYFQPEFAFTPDGQKLYATADDGAIQAWDCQTGTCLGVTTDTAAVHAAPGAPPAPPWVVEIIHRQSQNAAGLEIRHRDSGQLAAWYPGYEYYERPEIVANPDQRTWAYVLEHQLHQRRCLTLRMEGG